MIKQVSCSYCGAEESILLVSKKTTIAGPIVQCKKCGLVYVSPIEVDLEEFYRTKEVNPPRSHKDGPNVNIRYLVEREWKNKSFKKRLEKIYGLRKTGVLLDVGCHLGFFLDVAANQGFQVQGVEPNPFNAAYARDELGLQVETATLEECEFPNSCFDIVTLYHVLEHIENPIRLLQEIKRVLRDDGLLVVEVPRFNSASRRLFRSRWRSYQIDHLTYFTDSTLQAMLQAGGFQVVMVDYPGRYMSLNYFISRLERIHGFTSRLAKAVVERLHMENLTIYLNLRDIMTYYVVPNNDKEKLNP